MNYRTVELGDVCEFVYGESLIESKPEPGQIPVYGSNGIVGCHNQAITKGSTIVIGRKGSIGKVHFSSTPCYPIDTTYYIDRTKISCDLQWLFYILLALDLTNLNKSAAVPGLNRNDAYEKKIILPPLAEQKRIAAIAQKADRLRRTRRYALQLGDTFLQSVFLEMFGNPVTNPKRWKTVKLEEVCREITVGFVGSMTQEYVEKGIPFLRSQNVLKFILDLSSIKYITPEFHKKIKKSALYPKDLVVVRTGNAGSACIIPQSLSIANCSDLVIIRPAADINGHYLTCLFNSAWGQGSVTGNLVGQIQQHFNIGAAKEMLVHLPPLPLQEKFAQIVQKFERLRTQQQEAGRQAEHLFQTLLHRAFRGELTPQNANDEPVSILLEQIGAEQAKAETETDVATQAIGKAAEYFGMEAKQQDTEPIQLKLPGLE